MYKCLYVEVINVLVNLTTDANYPSYYRTSSERLSKACSCIEIGYQKAISDGTDTMTRNLYALQYVSNGTGEFMHKPLSENMTFVSVPMEEETLSAKKDFELAWILLKGSEATEVLSKINIPLHNDAFVFNKTQECANIIKEAIFENPTADPVTEACILQSVLYKILTLHSLDKPSNTSEELDVVQQIAQHLELNYNKPLKIDELAKEFHMSRSSMYMQFKNVYGLSPKEYIMDMRIERAKQLLFDKNHNTSIKEVSFAVGFDNQLYFSRLFHKYVGLSPTEYKNIQAK